MRGKADVIFCIDVSGSMQPTIKAVCSHVSEFVGGITAGNQASWDIRLGLLGYRSDGSVYEFETLDKKEGFFGLYGQGSAATLFTTSVAEFQNAVRGLEANGDEATFIAMDVALDFPWRDAADCHRILIVLTDEALETGVNVGEQQKKTGDLIQKIQALRVMLFLVAPPSAAFTELASVDKSEYVEVESTGDGLRNVDFSEVLRSIGKSVSVSQTGGRHAATARKALFGQDKWVRSAQKLIAKE